MKKFTLLFLLIPFFGFAQTFDFSNSDDGWDVLGAFNATTNSTFYTLTTVPGNDTIKNPSYGNAATGVNTADVSWIGITMKNNDATGPDYMRVSYLKPTGGRVYKNLDITTGDTDYVTYWVDLANANWTGTMDDIKIHFKAAGNTDYILPATPISIDVDKIEFADQPSTTLLNSYMFDTDGDAEGFNAISGSISGPAGGVITFTPVPAKYAKIDQIAHHVYAENKYVHITLKNNSALNNQLRLVSAGLDGTKTMEISVSDATEKTYTFDLTGETDWTGDQLFIVGIGSLEDGKAKDDGAAKFNSIVFDNTVSVNSTELVKFSMYPNPAKEILYIESPNTVSSVVMFDITGKQVLRLENLTNNQINISNLNPGIYTVKIESDHNNYTTKRLVVAR